MVQTYNPKNKDIQIYIGDQLYHRDNAKISVFDSSVQGGDAVWEGLRVYNGRIFSLDRHLQRLQESAKAVAFTDIPTNETIKKAIFETLQANKMRDGVHIRMTLTRGEKYTSSMDPRVSEKGPCLIIIPEWKPPVFDKPLRLVTSHIRRNTPQFLDSKIHHNNLLNNILAKLSAIQAGVDAALMLDDNGFVSEVNATNIFMSKNGVLYTSHADSCLPGITRGLVLEIANEIDVPNKEKNISLTEIYNADEVFTTGTMGELTNVSEIDGRIITNDSKKTVKDKIEANFYERIKTEGEELPF